MKTSVQATSYRISYYRSFKILQISSKGVSNYIPCYVVGSEAYEFHYA